MQASLRRTASSRLLRDVEVLLTQAATLVPAAPPTALDVGLLLMQDGACVLSLPDVRSGDAIAARSFDDWS